MVGQDKFIMLIKLILLFNTFRTVPTSQSPGVYGNKIETLQFVNSHFETMKSLLDLLQSHIVLINPFHVQQT